MAETAPAKVHGRANIPATISGVMTDLTLLRVQLPVGPERSGAVASLLDHLAKELSEAVRMLRQEASP